MFVITKYSCKGWTLAELVIVVLIAGIIASVGMSKYSNTMEQYKSSEGKQTLITLYSAQKRYSAENNGAYTNSINNLDVTIPVSENFNVPTVSSISPLAQIGRNDGTYTMQIDTLGTITCTPAGSAGCTKIGM